MSGSNASDLIGRSPDRRKLIAVVYADMVGYSHLIGLDDAGTLERLRSLRREVIDPAIEEHGGRIVQTGGDSLLIVFDSIDGAVRCAVKVQQQVPSHDRDQPPDRTIRFRVGINIGDAIADGTDLHGDAVNVAARIQAECPPGGICVTRAVRDHVQDRLGLAFEELGPVKLKNIARPVEAFVVITDGAAVPTRSERPPVGGTPDALPLEVKPSLAVLPFTDLSASVDHEYFFDGITEDIITELSRFPSLVVLARNSSFKEKSADVCAVARELGVRYLLEGSLRKAGRRMRVTVQLLDAGTGSHLWAEHYDRTIEDVFVTQVDVTRSIAAAVVPQVELAEMAQARRTHSNGNAAQLAWQARHLYTEGVRTGQPAYMLEAISAARQVIAAEPLLLNAHSVLANAYWHCHLYRWGPNPANALDEMWSAVESMQKIDALDYRTLTYCGIARVFRGEQERGLADLRRALEVNPNAAITLMWLSWAEVASGFGEDARTHALWCLRLSPRDHRITNPHLVLALASYSACDYAEAVRWSGLAIQSRPATPIGRAIMIACCGRAGDLNRASCFGSAQHLEPTTEAVIARRRYWLHVMPRSANALC
jgi:adenylate cyclase